MSEELETCDHCGAATPNRPVRIVYRVEEEIHDGYVVFCEECQDDREDATGDD